MVGEEEGDGVLEVCVEFVRESQKGEKKINSS